LHNPGVREQRILSARESKEEHDLYSKEAAYLDLDLCIRV